MKKFLIKLLFNKRQRMTMWHALVYSAYKYRKHGNVDAAVKVQMVMDEVQNKLGIVPTTFTKDEVDKIVNGVMNDAKKMEQNAYNAGVKQGINQANENKDKPVVSMIGVGSVVDLNKCEKCESKDGCIIYNSIKEVENDNKDVDENHQEEQPNDEEQKVETESETPTNETEAAVEEDKQ